jgi:hypothetical protein
MILCAHANAGFLNKTNSRSRAGVHIYLSKNDPFPCFNGAVLSIAQIIKFVMASAAEAELAALFVTAREMIPHRQTLIDMGWPNLKAPSRWITQLPQVLPTNHLSPTGPRGWICASGGYVAMDPKNNFAITGTPDSKIGQTTTPNTTRTPIMKHTKSRMQASGMHPVHRPVAILA